MEAFVLLVKHNSMEIPDDIKKIYKHWKYHTKNKTKTKKSKSKNNLFSDPALEKHIKWFIKERINIWKNKINNKKIPYTKDLVFQKYRFCNIFREFDKQTLEFHRILNPHRKDFSIWLLNMFYFRMVANIDTINKLGLLDFDLKNNKTFYKNIINLPSPKFGVPYVFPISVLLRSKYPTRELFISHFLPKIMVKVAEEIKGFKSISVCEAMAQIIPIFGYNLNFLWNEVLIDVAYQYPNYIDLYKDFPVGPGSIPTLKKINDNIDPEKLVSLLSDLDIKTDLFFEGKELKLSAENWEGIGCEYRKYTNLKNGSGRKRLFSK